MRKGLFVVGVLLVLATALGGLVALWHSGLVRDTAAPEKTERAVLTEAYGRVPLHFEANRGQTDERVKFLTRGRGYTMFLASNEAVVTLSQAQTRQRKDRLSLRREPESQHEVKRTVLRMTFQGANQKPRMEGREELRGKANYFIGNDPAKWRTNVPTYARVHYQDLYPGIDLVYYGNQRALEYDFVVHPGADPSRIALGFEGADKVEVDAQGDLVLHTALGAIRQRKPIIYQEVGGVRQEIWGGYVLNDQHQAGIRVSAYDASRPLVIDPVLFYSTYLGGSSFEQGIAIAVDGAGSAYVTGNTGSIDFPTTMGAFDTVFDGGDSDAFVTKLNPTGSGLVYSTFLGGSDPELGLGIAVDATGHAYASGFTDSTNFPTTALAFDTTANGGSDAFVVRLDPDGAALMYSTYLGGSSDEQGGRIAVDAVGNAYTTGSTFSIGFPTTAGAFDTTFNGDQDGFVTKLDSTGSLLLYSTYLGGSGSEFGQGIAVDAAGHAYVAGITTSTNFPTNPGAFDTTLGFEDGFVTKFDPAGSALVYSTYLGGSGGDAALSIRVDTAGDAYVQGNTDSTDFPTTAGAFDTTSNGGRFDVFVTKVNGAGSGLVYSTYLGGSGSDQADGLALDAAGHAYVAGFTNSSDFPIVAGAFQPTFGGDLDAFVTKLDAAGSGLDYSTYLGSSGADIGFDIAVDALPSPNAYVVGLTGSTNFPTTAGAFDTTVDLEDAFVAQVADVDVQPGPFTERVTGGGTIDVEGGIANFHFLVQRGTDGTLSGRLQYFNHASGARVRSESYASLLIVGNTATFDGMCTVDGDPCTFTVNVADNGEPGTTDTFTISVSGGPPEGGVLRSGNILIHEQ